jgi:hypothetical protein
VLAATFGHPEKPAAMLDIDRRKLKKRYPKVGAACSFVDLVQGCNPKPGS